MIVHNHRLIFFLVVLETLLGFFWYSEFLFLNPWLQSIGKELSQVQREDPLPFIIAVLGSFFLCYFISWLVQRIELQKTAGAVVFAIALWTCVIFPLFAVHYQFIGLPWTTIAIDTGRELVILLINSIVLVRWGHMPRMGSNTNESKAG